MSVKKFLRKELVEVRVPSTRIRVTRPPGFISLGSGDPDFNQPKFIADAVHKAILEGYTHYSFGGDREFKEAIANYYRKYGVEVDPQKQVVITSGGSQGIFSSFAAILNPGEEMILFDPTYMGYNGAINFLGGKIVRSSMNKDDQGYFRPDLEELKEHITGKTKALVVCNPDNPTGCVFTKEELSAIADLAVEHDFIVISDEIYTEFLWGGREHFPIISLPEMADRTIVVMSFSKMFAWTGCRVGFIISGSSLAPYIGRVPLGITSVPVAFQKAGIIALKEGWDFVNYMRRRYEERVGYCYKRLNEMGNIKCVNPEAAFYLFPDISATGLNSKDFASNLMKEEKLRVVSGSVYGSKGEGHVRMALVKPMKVLVEAMDRIERFVK